MRVGSPPCGVRACTHALSATRTHCSKNADLRMIYITDVCSDSFRQDDENDGPDLELLCTAIEKHAISVEFHILPRPEALHPNMEARAALRRLADASPDAVWSELPAAELRRLARAPETYYTSAPTPSARLTLDLGPRVRVPVWLFRRISEARCPSLSTLVIAPSTGGEGEGRGRFEKQERHVKSGRRCCGCEGRNRRALCLNELQQRMQKRDL